MSERAPSLDGSDTSRAWLMVFIAPFALFVGLLVGFALERLLLPSDADAEPSAAADVTVGLVVSAFWVVPAALAVRWGLSSVRLGDRWGWAPAGIGIVMLLVWAVVALVAVSVQG